MNEPTLNELEVAPVSAVKQAARDFATVLKSTPQFQAFQAAARRLQQDQAAQQARQAYQQKQQALRLKLMLNAVSAEERVALERLYQAWMAHESVQAYLQAQQTLLALCQTLGDLLSTEIGLDYAAACGVSCCG